MNAGNWDYLSVTRLPLLQNTCSLPTLISLSFLNVFHHVTQHVGPQFSVASIMSDSVTPWTVAHQAPLSMGFSRQGYWSGLPCPPPGDLPNPGIEPRSPTLQADSLPSEPPGKIHTHTHTHTHTHINHMMFAFLCLAYFT